MAPDGDATCIRCGHCVAVCPHGALNHAEIPAESCPTIDKDLMVSEEQLVQLIRSRRSVRLYKAGPVERDKLQRLIEIARYAPTGSNSQLVEWVVIDDRKRLDAICGTTMEWLKKMMTAAPDSPFALYAPLLIEAWEQGIDVVLRGAPCLVVAMAPAEALTGTVDVPIALTHLELAAPVFGLGTCWVGMVQAMLMTAPESKEILGVPEAYPHHYPMMIGQPKVRYQRMPERKAPRITWL